VIDLFGDKFTNVNPRAQNFDNYVENVFDSYPQVTCVEVKSINDTLFSSHVDNCEYYY